MHLYRQPSKGRAAEADTVRQTEAKQSAMETTEAERDPQRPNSQQWRQQRQKRAETGRNREGEPSAVETVLIGLTEEGV